MVVPKILHYAVELRAVRPKVDFSRPPVVYTNDLRSAEFQFEITDMSVTDLSTATATTLLYMRDGSFFQNPKEDVDLVGTTFSYTLKENEGNHAGIAKIQLIVTIGEAEYATQLYEFEIINGLETKVAQEVMIYDWTMLTREARDYIDQFVADELLRDAEFDNAQFDRNVAFVSSQESRTLAFGTEQTNRGTAFTAEQNERTTAFNESESGRTTAETGRVTAESNRVTAESGRVTKESQRVTAESNRVTAEGNRVTAEGGRVTAESGRVTAETNRAAAFTAFDTRLTAEETATAANKISAVKSKTFADVDARFEDVEADTTMMGTNILTNGDFSNGTAGWSGSNTTTLNVVTGVLNFTATLQYGRIYQRVPLVEGGKKLYVSALVKSDSGSVYLGLHGATVSKNHSGSNTFERLSAVVDKFSLGELSQVGIFDGRVLGWSPIYVDNMFAIDLTTTFGAGNEPTAEQMDGIMAKFTNSWFDGTKNLFRANATLNKLMAVDARTEFEARNMVANGNFASDIGGDGIADSWAASGSLIGTSVLNNIQTFTPTIQYAGIRSNGINLQQNSKYYLIGYVKGPLSTVLQISDYGVYTLASITVADTFNKLSCIYSKTTATSIGASIAVQYNSTSGFGETQVKYVTLIDLTATFGAGKEPTLAEMDRLMARFPNSWFDGVKPIQTIETLYQEKANKVQEAWITPTLINNWIVNPIVQKCKYYKDALGIVHIEANVQGGTTNTTVFILPVGYRPSATNYIQLYNSLLCTIFTTGEVKVGGTVTPWVAIDNVSFRTE